MRCTVAAVVVAVALAAVAAGLEPLEEGFHHDVDETTFSIGVTHACALKAVPDVEYGGRPRCWGNSRFNRTNAVDDLYIQISAGEFASCGVTMEETVKCWGQHAFSPPSMDFMGQLQFPTTGSYVQVSSGLKHVCALATDGTLSCWGDNSRRATDAPAGQFVQVSCRSDECCAIRIDGRLACWGGNNPSDREYWQYGEEGEKFTQVSTGTEFVCAIREDMELRCWGRRSIKNGMPPPGTEILMISAGTRQICAMFAENNKLYCWGGVHGAPPGLELAF